MRRFWGCDCELLHLLKLMHSKQPLNLPPMCPSLPPKTTRISSHPYIHFLYTQILSLVIRGKGLFTGGYEVGGGGGQGVDVLDQLLQLT